MSNDSQAGSSRRSHRVCQPRTTASVAGPIRVRLPVDESTDGRSPQARQAHAGVVEERLALGLSPLAAERGRLHPLRDRRRRHHPRHDSRSARGVTGGTLEERRPVLRAPDHDLAPLGRSALANNDFLFTANSPPPIFLPGVHPPRPFPAAVADPLGLICPHAAHIRKVNPRDQDSDLGDQFDTLIRRVLRRGVPYGPTIQDPVTDDGVDRGLHFLFYQTSIEQQFEVPQQNWANSASALTFSARRSMPC
jgi:hypothetical protein